MGIYDRDYMKRRWKVRVLTKMPPILKERKLIPYWTVGIILLLSGLQLGFILAWLYNSFLPKFRTELRSPSDLTESYGLRPFPH